MSRYKNTSMIHGSKFTYGFYTRPAVFDTLEDDDVIRYTVPPQLKFRPDLIAQEFYGDVKHSWIIISFNNPLNPVRWPSSGEIILIPDQSTIMELF